MAKKALVILAAGIGSRYKGGVKQLEPVGVSGETIMEYAIFDALNCGFDKLVFIIRPEMESEFRRLIASKYECHAEVCFAYQHIDMLPEEFSVPEGRQKPWGTGHALACCKGILNEPFVIINADDFYGRSAVEDASRFLDSIRENPQLTVCMPGFILRNTLSASGSVTRGICTVQDGYLQSIDETRGIHAQGSQIVSEQDGIIKALPADSVVSMNMWGSVPALVDVFEKEFRAFIQNLQNIPESEQPTAELLLPEVINRLIGENALQVRVFRTESEWFGMTHAQDKDEVKEKLAELCARGDYPKSLAEAVCV